MGEKQIENGNFKLTIKIIIFGFQIENVLVSVNYRMSGIRLNANVNVNENM